MYMSDNVESGLWNGIPYSADIRLKGGFRVSIGIPVEAASRRVLSNEPKKA